MLTLSRGVLTGLIRRCVRRLPCGKGGGKTSPKGKEERKKERARSNKVMAASRRGSPSFRRERERKRESEREKIDRVPAKYNAQVGDGAHSRRRRDGFTFQSETPLPLTFQWRLISRLVPPRPPPGPRLACQTPTFLRKCLPTRSLFERKRHGGGLSGARPSRRDTSADRCFTNKLGLSPL